MMEIKQELLLHILITFDDPLLDYFTDQLTACSPEVHTAVLKLVAIIKEIKSTDL